MTPKDRGHVDSLLGAYALQALDPEEQATVDAHLAVCDTCRAALSGYRAVAQALLEAAAPLAPSPRARARLMARISRARRPGRALGTPISLPRWGLAAGIAAVLIVDLVLVWQVRLLRSDQARILQGMQVDQTAISLASYPTTEVVLLEGDAVGGTFLYEPERRFAVLHMWGLDPLDPGLDYQAWFVRPDGSRVSGGLFAADPHSVFTSAVLTSPDPVGEFTSVGVTVEPSGGSPQPTGPRVLSADL
jgi:anti-sigma-K factor RskA